VDTYYIVCHLCGGDEMTEVKGELTAELALKLTFDMWEDIAETEKLRGSNLDLKERILFKIQWLKDRGFVDARGICNVRASCLLCEYAKQQRETKKAYNVTVCDLCPIDWSVNKFNACTDYRESLIDYEYTPAAEFLEYMKTHVRKEIN
jgi:hypothetical protein